MHHELRVEAIEVAVVTEAVMAGGSWSLHGRGSGSLCDVTQRVSQGWRECHSLLSWRFKAGSPNLSVEWSPGLW